MKRILFCALMLLFFAGKSRAQNVFDPLDPIIRYDSRQPLGSQKHPDPDVPGLQKWVSSPTIGVSTGTDTFDNTSFKQYFINFRGQGIAFRMKYPKSYRNPDSVNKKYPVMLFLHGGGEVGCPSNGGIYNNERPIWLGGKLFRDKVDQGAFDGFLLYPQYVIAQGCFGGWLGAPADDFHSIFAMIDSMAKYARADIDRVVANGLSGGGYGCFRAITGWPQRIAKIIPTSTWGPTGGKNAFVHIPIWFATGQLDAEPSPEQAQTCVNQMRSIGADIRHTNFEKLGHNCWYPHWRMPEYIPEMLSAHKANPLVFFQHNEFCSPDNIDAKLGITQGFFAYEWQKDGVLIATGSLGINTITDPSSVISNTGNEISVKAFGVYRVRFKRTAGSDWSVWSPKPAIIKTKSTTQTAAIQVDGDRSKVLTALDGSTTVPLVLPEGYLNYKWYRVSDNAIMDTTRKFNAVPGVYKAMYDEQFGCSTEFSPDFTVTDANGAPKPNPASELTAVPVTQTILKLDWQQASGGAADAYSGFEVYRSTVSGGPYTFIRLLGASAFTFKDSNLVANTLYYYKIRSVNGTGAASPCAEAAVRTVNDNSAPTAPSNLTATVGSATAVQLKWSASSDNNGVARYDIYVNGVKLYTTTLLQFTVPDLDTVLFYRFTVRAVDEAGNISAPGNQVTVNTNGKIPLNLPGSPSAVRALAISYTKIAISWSDTTNNETGFEITRSSSSNGTFINIGTVLANTTGFSDSGLVASKAYYYKVRAIASNGESPYSEVVSATTEALPLTPIPPTGLTATVPNNGNVALAWVDNASNETGYQVYRSSDRTTFTLLSSLPVNSNAYSDESAAGAGVYYYFVTALNGSGNSPSTDTLLVNAGNKAPVLAGITNLFVRKGSTGTLRFTVTDEPGDIVTVSIADKPSFVTLQHPSVGNYTLLASPGSDNSGTYTMVITATDDHGRFSSSTIILTVGNKNSKSVFINFGNTNKLAAAPWNNWLGPRSANDIMGGMTDETGTASAITVTTVNAWSGTTNLGHITGNNSGAFPDDVLQSGLADSSSARIIAIGGLNPSMQYNLTFAGSQNEGSNATSSYEAAGQTATLNARNNMMRTANLNNLIPSAEGVLTVTITRSAGVPVGYLNGMVIEEFAPSVLLPEPADLYAEATDRTTINLTWNDRTNNENVNGGYELQRAGDSLFTSNMQSILLPFNTTAYTNTGLTANSRYWFRVRAVGASGRSDFSNSIREVTAASLVYVNFNTNVEGSPTPWNNLDAAPISTFTTDFLKDQSGVTTGIKMSLTKEFNGEFTAGVRTGNNSGMVPDNVLASDYWLDKRQVAQFVVKGLNHGKMYRFGFFGSSAPPDWFKGNYTATYSINERTVYLNSWLNSTKIVYISDVTPDDNGEVSLNFSTAPDAAYGFNGGVILQEYTNYPSDTVPADTIPTDPGGGVDTIPTDPGGGVDTIPPPPGGGIDSIPPVGGGNPDPDSTITDPVTGKLKIYPNPVSGSFRISFYNDKATNDISIAVYDMKGVNTYQRNYGRMPEGNNVLPMTIYETNLKKGIYIVTLRVSGRLVESKKLVLINY